MGKGNSQEISIGLRAKTARAIAVILGGPLDSPRVLKRAELILWDPATPATGQPYHEVMDMPWERSKAAVRKIERKIERVASKALRDFVRDAKADGFIVCGIGIAGAGDRNLERIGSTHIRAHAAEGVLFRRVLEFAAATNSFRSTSFNERVLEETAAAELQCPVGKLKSRLAEMGRAVGSPWRADEKTAATAAWLALAAYGGGTSQS
jgi:hypothetical protein